MPIPVDGRPLRQVEPRVRASESSAARGWVVGAAVAAVDGGAYPVKDR